MRNRIAPFICALIMGAVPATALAQTSRTAALTQSPKVSAVDISWVQAAAQANIAQLEAAKLAQSKSHNLAVLAVARVIFNDHSKLLLMTDKVANALGIQLPTAPSDAQATMLSGLESLTGRAFNMTFAEDEVTGHEQFIQLTDQEISTGTDAAIKAVAKVWLPYMQRHLQYAHAAAVALGATS